MTVEIYTDGACSHNTGAGGWGVVKVEKGEVVFSSSGRADCTTSNRMELVAAIKGVELAILHPIQDKVIIYSDSNYVVKGITEWVDGWIKRGWKNSKKQPTPNKEFWIALLDAKHKWNTNKDASLLEFKWIKGHNGNKWNELADKLAVKAKEEYEH